MAVEIVDAPVALDEGDGELEEDVGGFCDDVEGVGDGAGVDVSLSKGESVVVGTGAGVGTSCWPTSARWLAFPSVSRVELSVRGCGVSLRQVLL